MYKYDKCYVYRVENNNLLYIDEIQMNECNAEIKDNNILDYKKYEFKFVYEAIKRGYVKKHHIYYEAVAVDDDILELNTTYYEFKQANDMIVIGDRYDEFFIRVFSNQGESCRVLNRTDS